MAEELKAVIASAHDVEDTRQDSDVARFLRDHGQALVESVDKAAMWDICNGTHVEDGVEARCHVIVGLNEWKDGEWYGYTTCTPDEIAQLLDLARTKAGAVGEK